MKTLLMNDAPIAGYDRARKIFRSTRARTSPRRVPRIALAVVLAAVTLTPAMGARVAHATPAVVNPNVMDCIPGTIDVGAPDAYSTTQNLWWIPSIYFYDGAGVSHVGYGDWHYKNNTGSLYTNWTNATTGFPATYNHITTNPGYYYAVYVWVYSNGDWYGYWAQTPAGEYWCS